MNGDTANKILARLSSEQDEMVRVLTDSVAIESPSAVPATQQPMFQLLENLFADLNYRCRRLRGRNTGGQLLAIPRGLAKHSPRQLLLGHCDTVWPEGTLEKMPIETRDGRLHGPGSYDMKCGLVQAVFAVQALKALRIQPTVAPIFFINSDEEIGSPESAGRIRHLARIVDRAFVMEPSLGPTGKLKTARKGVGRFEIKVLGEAAHAGLDPDKGVSAILELSHVVQALFALNDPGRGITVNVGTIDGGMRPNVVAPESSAQVDVRVPTQKDADEVEAAIYNIQPTVPGTELQITGRVGRPPLERTPRNRKLWHLAQQASAALGMDIDEGAAGGGSDGNWTSLFTPTLDGMGAVGDGAHALTEHVIIEKMPRRAALLACLLLHDPISVDNESEAGLSAQGQRELSN